MVSKVRAIFGNYVGLDIAESRTCMGGWMHMARKQKLDPLARDGDSCKSRGGLSLVWLHGHQALSLRSMYCTRKASFSEMRRT